MNNITKFDKQPFKGCLSLLKDNVLLVLGIALVFALNLYCIMGAFGFVAFPDEFGYWSVAGALLGYDWSEITSIGSYYSYGYGILLVIFLKLFKDAVIAYRAAIFFNMMLQCISIPIIYRVLTDLFPTEQKNTRQMAAVISCLYPAWIFYTQTTMAESLLYFLFILAAFLFMEFLKKPNLIRGGFFVLILIYCYFVHMRSIGIIVSGVLTVLIWIISKRKNEISKKVWLIPLFILGLFAVSFIIKNLVVGKLYSSVSANVLSWNDYSSVPERIHRIIAGKGMIYFLKDIAGKLFYIGIATYGLAYIGLFLALRQCIKSLTKVKDKTAAATDIFWIYIFLAALFEFGVELVYLGGASSPNNVRIDLFLHGRYMDFCLPLYIGIGICDLTFEKKLPAKAISVFALTLLLFIPVRAVFSQNAEFLREGNGFLMIGASFFFGTAPVDDPVRYLQNQTLLSLALMAIVFGAILIFRRLKTETILFALVIVEIVLSFRAFEQYLFPNQFYIYQDIEMGKKLEEVRKTYPDRDVYYVFEGEAPYIELVQFEDRKAKIHVVNTTIGDEGAKEHIKPDNILILSDASAYLEEAESSYANIVTMGHLHMFYE